MDACILEDRPEEGITIVNGKTFWIDQGGSLIREELVKPQHRLEDQTVRKIIGYARELSAQVSRFKLHTMADLATLDALMAEQYGFVKKGNKGKGNRTYMTFDGLMKVQVQVAEFMDFGPELQIAKGLVDECLNEWSAESGPEIQTIVTRAFKTDQEGQVNRAAVLMLLRLDIGDERWKRAMDAIRDAQRPRASKEYVRFGMRDHHEAAWMTITIDLAQA